jgi:co-chaperonin GroES (HSP10)
MSEQRHRPTRIIHPLGMRVLVKVMPRDDRSSAGLYLPETVESSGVDALYGEVQEVARADDDADQTLEGGANVSGVPDGALVLFAPDAGFRVPWDDSLRLIDTKDVLAWVEEFLPEQAN